MAELNTTEISNRINTLFDQDKQFVFWYDEKQDFLDNIDEISNQLNGRLIQMAGDEQFKTKLELIEIEKGDEKVLIYSPNAKPALSVNFMADMLRYSAEYTADANIILREEIGLSASQQKFVNDNLKFFGNKDRIKRFSAIITANPNLLDLNIAILAVLSNSYLVSGIDILKSVLVAGTEDNSVLAEFEKYNVINTFWDLIAKQYGYNATQPRLIEFVSGLFVVYTFEKMDEDLPSSLSVYNDFKKATAVTVISNFLNMADMENTMQNLAAQVWDFINGQSIFERYDEDKLFAVDNFGQVDKIILTWITKRLLDDDFEPSGYDLNDLSHKRQKMFFKDSYGLAYKMLRKALLVLSAPAVENSENLHEAIINYIGGDAQVKLDRKNISGWQIDTAYRKFIQYKKRLSLDLQTAFDDLATKVERKYLEKYLNPVITDWTNVFSYDSIDREHLQRDFFNNKVGNTSERSVVIISDAFRFEAAKELQKKITLNENQLTSEMDYMITGLPSVTYFGMPALLPHTTMNYDSTVPTVLLDGQRAVELKSRSALLGTYHENTLALHAEDVLNAKVADLKEQFSGKEIIYIYHNQIDAKADNAKTEQETFEATATAIDEIINLIKRLRSGNISNVMITADHGFIYRQSPLETLDKIDLKAADYLKKAPRYAISNEQFEQTGVKSIPLANVLDNIDAQYVYYPVTANIFNAFGAGKNYVHGGASPQEMIVPLLSVHSIKGKDSSKSVEVGLIPGIKRITSTHMPISILQKEVVNSAVKGAIYSVYFENEDGKVISSKEIVNAFSQEDDAEKRIFKLRISLFDRNYDKSKKYYLVAENNENGQKTIYEEYGMDISISGGLGLDFS